MGGTQMRRAEQIKIRRFEGSIAIQFRTGESWTTPSYIEGDLIPGLIQACQKAEKDIRRNAFADSKFNTVLVPEEHVDKVLIDRLTRDLVDARRAYEQHKTVDNNKRMMRAHDALSEAVAKLEPCQGID